MFNNYYNQPISYPPLFDQIVIRKKKKGRERVSVWEGEELKNRKKKKRLKKKYQSTKFFKINQPKKISINNDVYIDI